jgi:hypothetical protein
MTTNSRLDEYWGEIQKDVCSRCPERPQGGPPCQPLGKQCGVELHFPALMDSIHMVHSNRIEPYLEQNRAEICQHCAFLNSSTCPCPMESLAALIVQAVKTVDQRHDQDREDKAVFSVPKPDRRRATCTISAAPKFRSLGRTARFRQAVALAPFMIVGLALLCLTLLPPLFLGVVLVAVALAPFFLLALVFLVPEEIGISEHPMKSQIKTSRKYG